jgi:hypothetical protein
MATFWWALRGYSILLGVGAPYKGCSSSGNDFHSRLQCHPSAPSIILPFKKRILSYPSSSPQESWESLQGMVNHCVPVKTNYYTYFTSAPVISRQKKKSTIFTLYQKFTVMVIPPFSNDSMWCHLQEQNQALFFGEDGKLGRAKLRETTKIVSLLSSCKTHTRLEVVVFSL